ncbi:hypothetical protein N9Y00_07070 [Tateyamaria sp.]|nr:hypothetical protein [Tateyamaria sp.]
MNRFQKTCREAYPGYVFGDTLFDFLDRELSDEGDCEDLETARQRMDMVLADVTAVHTAIQALEDEPE